MPAKGSLCCFKCGSADGKQRSRVALCDACYAPDGRNSPEFRTKDEAVAAEWREAERSVPTRYFRRVTDDPPANSSWRSTCGCVAPDLWGRYRAEGARPACPVCRGGGVMCGRPFYDTRLVMSVGLDPNTADPNAVDPYAALVADEEDQEPSTAISPAFLVLAAVKGDALLEERDQTLRALRDLGVRPGALLRHVNEARELVAGYTGQAPPPPLGERQLRNILNGRKDRSTAIKRPRGDEVAAVIRETQKAYRSAIERAESKLSAHQIRAERDRAIEFLVLETKTGTTSPYMGEGFREVLSLISKGVNAKEKAPR